MEKTLIRQMKKEKELCEQEGDTESVLLLNKAIGDASEIIGSCKRCISKLRTGGLKID